MTASKIEWTTVFPGRVGRSDWNPVRGCTRISEGCRPAAGRPDMGRSSRDRRPVRQFALSIAVRDRRRQYRHRKRV